MTGRIKNNNIYRRVIFVMVLAIFALMTITLVNKVYADEEFALVESYPKDGAKNAAVENLGVKLLFTNDVNAQENHEANSACFTLLSPEGEKLPTKMYYNPKNPKEILVLYDTTETGPLTTRTSEHYTFTVSKDFKDNNGNALGTDQVIEFDTINQSFNTRVYMVAMLLMIAGMAFFTQLQARKKASGEGKDGEGKEEAFNPYKEAKRTGKSVAEVVAIHEKEVAKAEAKAAKENSRLYDDEDDFEEEEEDSGNYKVKGPRPISAGGSTYITGRKALAEAKKAEEERLAKRRANAKKKK